MPKGILAMDATSNVLIIPTSAVVVKTALGGMAPKAPKMLGLTANIYDIVRNEVRPANISVRTVVFCASYPNRRFSICLSCFFVGFYMYACLGLLSEFTMESILYICSYIVSFHYRDRGIYHYMGIYDE